MTFRPGHQRRQQPVRKPGTDVFNISMTSPFGHARFEARARDIERFLARTFEIVPAGDEPSFMNFDDELIGQPCYHRPRGGAIRGTIASIRCGPGLACARTRAPPPPACSGRADLGCRAAPELLADPGQVRRRLVQPRMHPRGPPCPAGWCWSWLTPAAGLRRRRRSATRSSRRGAPWPESRAPGWCTARCRRPPGRRPRRSGAAIARAGRNRQALADCPRRSGSATCAGPRRPVPAGSPTPRYSPRPRRWPARGRVAATTAVPGWPA